MHLFDWLILGLFVVYTLWDGLRHQHGSKDLEGMFLAGRSMPWWAMGLSVMATQASAITLIGTTGQAFAEDMRFVQVYLGLPIAVVILCITLVPFYHRLRVFTIYETLEERFGLSTRLVTSGLFLISRGASLGIVIAAPAYILALILEWPFERTIWVIGTFATIYTMFGGITGVIRTDVKQMVLMMIGLAACFGWLWKSLPDEVGMHQAMELAGMSGKLQSIDFHFDPAEKYNFWSGLVAGLFLMLSYFGADQSQVQRYLTARSLTDARFSLILSGIAKIPMQFVILLFGALLYVHFVFSESPLVFLPDASPPQSVCVDEVSANQLWQQRRDAAMAWAHDPKAPQNRNQYLHSDQQYQQCRQREMRRMQQQHDKFHKDTNFVFPHFVLHVLPKGLTGLLVAAILAAALSSIDSLLNSLTTSTMIDWWQRLAPQKRSDTFYLWASRGITFLWGLFATLTAIAFGQTESIVEVINQVGSYFYGPILGVFLLLWVPRVRGKTALIALLIGMGVVLTFGTWYHSCGGGETAFFFPFGQHPDGFRPRISYLWLNPIGTFTVLLVGLLGRRRS
ncbi:MAG: sodium:solute symporter [Bacteroidota bacterium]